MSLRFRRAQLGDWPAIWPIWSAVVAAGDTYTYDPGTDYESAEQMWLGSGEVWLAYESDSDSDPVGVYRLSRNQGGPGAHIANASYMVAARERGRGIGRELVGHCLERARSAGYRGIQFNAVAATNVGAVKLYHDLGFATVGVVPGGFRHPVAGFVDLLIMYRSL